MTGMRVGTMVHSGINYFVLLLYGCDGSVFTIALLLVKQLVVPCHAKTSKL